MFEVDLGAMLDIADAAGGPSASEWNDGQYRCEIVRTNVGKTADGKNPKIGIMWKALNGEYEGQTSWENITVNKSNPTSVAIFMNKLVKLGIQRDFLKQSPPLEQVLAMLEGLVADVEFSKKPWKQDKNKFSNEFKVLRLIDTDIEDTVDSSSDESGLFGNS